MYSLKNQLIHIGVMVMLFIISTVCSVLTAVLSIVNFVYVDVQNVKMLKSQGLYRGFLDDAVMRSLDIDGLTETVFFKINVILFIVAMVAFIVGFIKETDSAVPKILMPIFKLLQYIPILLVAAYDSDFHGIHEKMESFLAAHGFNENIYYAATLIAFILLGIIAALICRSSDCEHRYMLLVLSGSFLFVFTIKIFVVILIVAVCAVVLSVVTKILAPIISIAFPSQSIDIFDKAGNLIGTIYFD